MSGARQLGFGAHLCAAALFVAAGLCATSANAQASRMDGIALSSDKPIQIESDKLEIKDRENRADFSGNVTVVQGSTTLRAGAMTVYYKSAGGPVSTKGSADIDRIVMSGRVVLSSGAQKASADSGSFNMQSETLILEGSPVVLSEGDNIFSGCKLTVLMRSGQAKLDSCGGRVQIQLDPKSGK